MNCYPRVVVSPISADKLMVALDGHWLCEVPVERIKGRDAAEIAAAAVRRALERTGQTTEVRAPAP